jgi:anaerobic nitric oxide reductase flavorubredoxin
VENTKAVKIAENVFWVGAIDWDLRNFHGYSTPRGSSYNAYLITGEKNVLIDAVKQVAFGQLLERIETVIDPSDIDIIISNHTEMDHSGGLPQIQEISGARILASSKGKEGLAEHFPELKVEAVGDQQEIDIGGKTLRFIETPMLHWPDSMFTYLVEDGILFSMDGFGQHYASSRRFDDQVPEEVLMEEAAKYYANILLPFGKMFQKTFEKIKGLELKMLATSHGVIWRSKIDKIVSSYIGWANGETEEKAVIAYDTMWGSTRQMAYDIAEGIASKGPEVQVWCISETERSHIMYEILDARAVLIGSPTINNCVFPPVAAMVEYMKGLRPKDRLGAAFGSYGWGGGAVKALHEQMEKGGLSMAFDDLHIKYRPTKEDRKRCVELGEQVGERIMQG